MSWSQRIRRVITVTALLAIVVSTASSKQADAGANCTRLVAYDLDDVLPGDQFSDLCAFSKRSALPALLPKQLEKWNYVTCPSMIREATQFMNFVKLLAASGQVLTDEQLRKLLPSLMGHTDIDDIAYNLTTTKVGPSQFEVRATWRFSPAAEIVYRDGTFFGQTAPFDTSQLIAHEKGHESLTSHVIAAYNAMPAYRITTLSALGAEAIFVGSELPKIEASLRASIKIVNGEYERLTNHGVTQSALGGTDVSNTCPPPVTVSVRYFESDCSGWMGQPGPDTVKTNFGKFEVKANGDVPWSIICGGTKQPIDAPNPPAVFADCPPPVGVNVPHGLVPGRGTYSYVPKSGSVSILCDGKGINFG